MDWLWALILVLVGNVLLLALLALLALAALSVRTLRSQK